MDRLVASGELGSDQAQLNKTGVSRAIADFRAERQVDTSGLLPFIASLLNGLFDPHNATFVRSDDAIYPPDIARRVAHGTRALVTCGTADTNVPCRTTPPLLTALAAARTTGPGWAHTSRRARHSRVFSHRAVVGGIDWTLPMRPGSLALGNEGHRMTVLAPAYGPGAAALDHLQIFENGRLSMERQRLHRRTRVRGQLRFEFERAQPRPGHDQVPPLLRVLARRGGEHQSGTQTADPQVVVDRREEVLGLHGRQDELTFSLA
ncbi:hypothetical protein ACH4Q6_30405 [Streptomyces lydicus]|uniref:hypothetical protein n=1 Tax=Streptomyces lydicus TaxID=47763 RepID=UPI0037964409